MNKNLISNMPADVVLPTNEAPKRPVAQWNDSGHTWNQVVDYYKGAESYIDHLETQNAALTERLEEAEWLLKRTYPGGSTFVPLNDEARDFLNPITQEQKDEELARKALSKESWNDWTDAELDAIERIARRHLEDKE